MSDPIIRVENLGKQYQLGLSELRHKTFRETLVDLAAAPWRRLRHLAGAGDEAERIWALRDVSFEVERGEVLGVIGRNGAGKSTLLKILTRITEPTAGRAEVRGHVGSLLEVGTGFHPELTGRENVFLNGAILGMSRATIRRRFDEIVEFSGVEKFLDTPVKHYSSGMHVRLAFAVAAHLDPEILLIDEVLAVGDAEFQKRCLGKMGDVARGGRTVLFVSHNMPAIQVLCERCLLLQDGRVVADGATETVMRRYLAGHCGELAGNTLNTTKRTGNGRARFVSVEIRDGSGTPVNQILAGHPFSVAMGFSLQGPALTDPNFAVEIRSDVGARIVRVMTSETEGSMPAVMRDGAIRVDLDPINLLPGTYLLTIGISDRGTPVDIVEDAIPLVVAFRRMYKTPKMPDRSKGLILFGTCSWTADYA
jgi:lipopolysaccharide transport system ATP-binding protein